jgi:hypothetical protein
VAQIIQILGSLLILSAYAAAQRGVLSQRSRAYLVLNLVGSAVLTVFAASAQQFGFLLLEGCGRWFPLAGLGSRVDRLDATERRP